MLIQNLSHEKMGHMKMNKNPFYLLFKNISVSLIIALSLIPLEKGIAAESKDSTTQSPSSISKSKYIAKLHDLYQQKSELAPESYRDNKENQKKIRKLVRHLDLRSSSKEMFAHSGAIKHRPLTSQKLLVGCGNVPQSIHSHEGYDTIDFHFDKDPTVVMAIGDPRVNIAQVFGNHRYNEIYFETGSDIGPWFLNEHLICVFAKDLGDPLQGLRNDILAITNEGAKIYQLEPLNASRECDRGKISLIYIREGNHFVEVLN